LVRRLLVSAALVIGLLACVPAVAAASDPPDPGTTTTGTVTSNGTVYPYILYTPTSYTPGTPAPLVVILHGSQTIVGFRFGNAAYLTDHSEIPETSMELLRGLDVLFLDALRYKPHPTHSTVEQSLKIVEEVKPKRAFFTHICHDLPHAEAEAALPAGVRLAYDGMKLEFEI